MALVEYGDISSTLHFADEGERERFERSLEAYDGDGNLFRFLRPGDKVLSGLIPYLIRTHGPMNVDLQGVSLDGIELKIPADILPGITLHEDQVIAAEQFFRRKRGIIEFATGVGKTEIAAAIIIKMLQLIESGEIPTNGVPYVLVVVESKDGVFDFAERLTSRGINCGVITSGVKKNYKYPVLVTNRDTWYSGIKRKNKDTFRYSKNPILLIGDEIHHLATPLAVTWKAIFSIIPAPWRLGLSATAFKDSQHAFAPIRMDPRDSWLFAFIGELLCHMGTKEGQEKELLARGTMISWPGGGEQVQLEEWQYVERMGIMLNMVRNNRACNIAENLVLLGLKPLILIRLTEHGKLLLNHLIERGLNVAFCKGQTETFIPLGQNHFEKKNTKKYRTFERFEKGEIDVLVGNQIFNEQVNIRSLTDLILLAGGKDWKLTKQRQGRTLRRIEGVKTTARIWDPFDTCSYMLKSQSKKRRAISVEQGFYMGTSDLWKEVYRGIERHCVLEVMEKEDE